MPESPCLSLAAYGPSDTSFYVEASVETLGFIGDFDPRLDKDAYFDRVSVLDTVEYDTGFVADTSAYTHKYAPGGYSGVDPETNMRRVSNALVPGEVYHWHVRHRGSGGLWSLWSADSPDAEQNFVVGASPTATWTTTAAPTPTATPTPAGCTGDCNADKQVTVNELITMVNIALGNAPLSTCPAGDADGSGDITIDEIVQAVGYTLGSCPG